MKSSGQQAEALWRTPTPPGITASLHFLCCFCQFEGMLWARFHGKPTFFVCLAPPDTGDLVGLNDKGKPPFLCWEGLSCLGEKNARQGQDISRYAWTKGPLALTFACDKGRLEFYGVLAKHRFGETCVSQPMSESPTQQTRVYQKPVWTNVL